MRAKDILAPVFVVSALLVSACDNHGPTAPSSPSAQSPPVSTPGTTQVWNITVRLVTADGGECVGETMRSSQMGMPKSYSLSTTSKGGELNVTLRSASGDYACTFPAKAEGDGFTTFGVPGWMSCETAKVLRGFVCDNGTVRDLSRLGENISGHVSGNQISGEWGVSWAVMVAGGRDDSTDDIAGLEAMYQYAGSR
jgi:hypothetical protein